MVAVEWRQDARGDYDLVTPLRIYHVVRCGRSWFADGHAQRGPRGSIYVAVFASLQAAKVACEQDLRVVTQ
jgi:hypothetical protein